MPERPHGPAVQPIQRAEERTKNEMVCEVLDRRCAADCRAFAPPYWSYGPYDLKARGYHGAPYGPGPQYGNGGGDQYGYGPGYSYARQAPNWYRGPY
jgi:hypothetical protein